MQRYFQIIAFRQIARPQTHPIQFHLPRKVVQVLVCELEHRLRQQNVHERLHHLEPQLPFIIRHRFRGNIGIVFSHRKALFALATALVGVGK